MLAVVTELMCDNCGISSESVVVLMIDWCLLICRKKIVCIGVRTGQCVVDG